MNSCDTRFEAQAHKMGFDLDAPLKIGGHYAPLIQHGREIYISGQIPRIGDQVRVTGCAGREVSLAQAQLGAQICVMRALTLLRQQLGSLAAVEAVLRLTVYVQSAPDFTQQSEVADGASDLLFSILGEAGRHTRTSVGVAQLPKNATVEVDLIAVAAPA